MTNFEKCWGRVRFLLTALLVVVGGGPFFIVSGQDPASAGTASTPSVVAKSTANPTGLQVGVNPADSGVLPPGTEEFAKEGAMASADLDWPKAKAAYEKLLKVAPENALALSNLGAVEFRLGNVDSALSYLDRASRVAPGIAQNWLTIGLIHRGRGDSYLALSSLARALHADPGDPRAHNYMGVVIRGLGWTSGAETELQRAIALDPSYADAHFNLAVMYLDRTPPMLELARRHYYASQEYGAKPDEVIVQKLNAAPSAVAVPAPVPSGSVSVEPVGAVLPSAMPPASTASGPQADSPALPSAALPPAGATKPSPSRPAPNRPANKNPIRRSK